MSKSFHDMKCIWMESGFIDYKICEKDFDCDNCKLFSDIKRNGIFYREKENDNIDEDINNKKVKPLRLKDGQFCSSNHIWVKKVNHQVGTMGIDNFGIKLIKNFTTVHFQTSNNKLTKNKPFLWLINSKGAVSLLSPIDAEIVCINYEIKNDINNLLNGNGLETWLVQFKIDKSFDIKLSGLISDKYPDFILSEEDLLKSILLKKLDSYAIGDTMFDGGEISEDFYDILSEIQYIHLCEKIFNKK